MLSLFGAIEAEAGEKGLSHPNRLEKHGSVLWKRLIQSPVKSGQERGELPSTERAEGTGEGEENRIAQGAGAEKEVEWRGCVSKRVMVVVTINRVQDLYTNPVYQCPPSTTKPPLAAAEMSSKERGEGGKQSAMVDEGDVESLQHLLESGRQLDEQRYTAEWRSRSDAWACTPCLMVDV